MRFFPCSDPCSWVARGSSRLSDSLCPLCPRPPCSICHWRWWYQILISTDPGRTGMAAQLDHVLQVTEVILTLQYVLSKFKDLSRCVTRQKRQPFRQTVSLILCFFTENFPKQLIFLKFMVKNKELFPSALYLKSKNSKQ